MTTYHCSNDVKVSKRLLSFPKATAKVQIEKEILTEFQGKVKLSFFPALCV